MLTTDPSYRRTIPVLVLLVLVTVLAAQGGRALHSRINAPSQPQDVSQRGSIPYTVTLREIMHAPDGTKRVSREITHAIRHDGSQVFMTSTDKGTRRSLDFASGLKVDTNDLQLTKTSMNRTANNKIRQRDPNSKCLNSLDGKPFDSDQTMLGEETIAGYKTVKISSGIITSWYALDYGCAQVKDIWQFSPGEFTEKELVALVGGEPDAALFDVPAKYREVSPSERILGSNKPHNEAVEKQLRMLDEDYKRAKKQE
ncbi:MAG TPA: hypothetical protein VF290_21585 [Pyrinomonadaceae bacterium]